MPYVINNSRNQLIAVVQDGTIDTASTSQTLVGKDVSPYGELEMENLVHQLENFANDTPPENPIQGQIWYDTGTNVLYIYTVANAWKPVKGTTAAATPPAVNPIIGDLWFDTVTRQLKIYDVINGVATWIPATKVQFSASAPTPVIAGQLYWNTLTGQLFIWSGSSWALVGPQAVNGFGVTQWLSTTVNDTSSTPHAVMQGIVDSDVIAIMSYDSFTLDPATAPPGFSDLQFGLNLQSGSRMSGLATQAERLVPGRTINNVTFDGSQNIVIPAVTSVGLASGAGIVVAGGPITTAGIITVTNTGVTSLAVSGNGMTVDQANGAVTVTNTGVVSLSNGPGISVNQANGAVTVTNTGVTALASGAGVSINQVTGCVTVTNTGVTSLASGSGVSVDQANGAVTVTNTGVTGITAGTNVTISPSAGTGNVTINATASLGGVVLVDAFGALGDGVTNDSAAFQAAIDSLGTTGGRVLLSPNKFYRIGTTIVLKPSCHLQGQQNMIGSNGYNYYTDYNAIGSALWIDSTATINMKSGSSISKMLLRQRGMNYTSPSSFAGTAITILGTSPGAGNQGNTTVVGDDVTVYDCMFLGFNQAISAQYAQRLRVTQCNIDCINGILIDTALDIPFISRVHCWPFATIAAVAQGVAPNPNGSALTRTGTAFKFQNTVDWGKITDCFSYGYFRGYWVNSCNSCELTGCGADNVPEAGSSGSGANGFLGFVIEGGSTDTILTNCQAASNEKGFYINTVAGIPTQMINCVAWSNRDAAALIEGGDVNIIGGIFRQSNKGIQINSAASQISINNARISDITTRPIETASDETLITNVDFVNWTGSSPVSGVNYAITIPGTNAITLPNEGDFFVVSPGAGSGLGNLQFGWPGRKVTLKFSNNVTIFQSSATPGDIYLAGATNFTAVTNSTLTVISDGTYWYEIGRSSASSNREVISVTSTNLAAGAELNLDITSGASTYSLLQVASDYPARIRIYSSSTARTADASRGVGTDPLPGSGVISEVITYVGLPTVISGALTQNITPGVLGWTENDSNTIPIRITNDDSVTRTITIYLRVLKMEV